MFDTTSAVVQLRSPECRQIARSFARSRLRQLVCHDKDLMVDATFCRRVDSGRLASRRRARSLVIADFTGGGGGDDGGVGSELCAREIAAPIAPVGSPRLNALIVLHDSQLLRRLAARSPVRSTGGSQLTLNEDDAPPPHDAARFVVGDNCRSRRQHGSRRRQLL